MLSYGPTRHPVVVSVITWEDTDGILSNEKLSHHVASYIGLCALNKLAHTYRFKDMRRPKPGELLILEKGFAPYLYKDCNPCNVLDFLVVRHGTPMIALETSKDGSQTRVLTPSAIGWIATSYFDAQSDESW